jgi:class 3 adenylate cyclase
MKGTGDVRYASSGDVSVAYKTVGQGPDLVVVNGWVSHLDYMGNHPLIERVFLRLASFARLITFDKRGTGLSDRVSDLPDLQTRMDDVRAVMDAAESSKAALLGVSEGVPMCLLFAATYPERVTHLVLYGGMARSTATDDYPWAPYPEGIEMNLQYLNEWWGSGAALDVFAPSLADDAAFLEWWRGFERTAASPGAMAQLIRMFADIDVRALLPTIHVPTLIIHRKGDRVANYRGARWMAEQIPGARYVELPGVDHLPFAGDSGAVLDQIEEFVTGVRPVGVLDRVLATCLFTDIVGSTERAAGVGDARWRELLEQHHSAVKRQIDRFRGKVIKTMGDGVLATFDGPARGVVCAQEVLREAAASGLELRAGLHTGEIEIQRDDVAGLAVHIAARICAQAAGGQVLVSSTVKDLVAGSGLRFADAGSRPLKGVPGSWTLYSVI